MQSKLNAFEHKLDELAVEQRAYLTSNTAGINRYYRSCTAGLCDCQLRLRIEKTKQ